MPQAGNPDLQHSLHLTTLLLAMKPIYALLLLGLCACQTEQSVLSEHIFIDLYVYDNDGEPAVSALPALKPDSKLMPYSRRFDYLLMNVPALHGHDAFQARMDLNALYPDTVEVKRQYLNKYLEDEKLTEYFEAALAPIQNPDMERAATFSEDELMEVASKFFFCSGVSEDTVITTHICVGLNGVKEANWDKDFTLLEAFCYEAIFSSFDDEESEVMDAFLAAKKESQNRFFEQITTLEQYLEDVKLDLFEGMRTNEVLKAHLLHYYDSNKGNLAFELN